jgi:hypothetical protein
MYIRKYPVTDSPWLVSISRKDKRERGKKKNTTHDLDKYDKKARNKPKCES